MGTGGYSNLTNLIIGLAAELARVDTVVQSLTTEARVTTTSSLIAEHEQDFNIPNEYEDKGYTVAERRLALLGKQVMLGGQHKGYFLNVAEDMGLDICILERAFPFLCGISKCGDQIGGDAVMFYWIVCIKYDPSKATYANTGESYCGSSLAKYYNMPNLLNLLKLFKPAHSLILWNWYGPGFSSGFSKGFNAMPSGIALLYPLGGFSRGFSSGFNRFGESTEYKQTYWGGGFSRGFSSGFSVNMELDITTYFSGGFSKGFSTGFRTIAYGFSY